MMVDMHLIKHRGKVRVTESRDDKGRVAMVHVEHKDGRVDAVARPDVVRGRVRR